MSSAGAPYTVGHRTHSPRSSPIRKTLVNRDRLNSADKSKVGTAMVSLFDRLQSLPKEVQVLALAGAFALMTEVSKVTAPEAMTAVSNLMYDPLTSTGRAPQFNAMRFHLDTELKEGL